MNVRELIETSLYLAVVIALHFALATIPNITLTFILLGMYISNNKLYKGFILVTSFVIIINIVYGFSTFTLIQYVSYLTLLSFKYLRGVFGVIVVSVCQMWVYVPFMTLVFGYDLWSYVIADLPFTIIYTINNVILYVYLYERLKKVIYN